MHLKTSNRALLCLLVSLLGISISSSSAVAQEKGPPSGVVVSESPNYKKFFCATPSIAILPNGDYLIAHAYKVPRGNPATGEIEIHKSTNKGRNWSKVATVDDLNGGTLVVKGDEVYLIGTLDKPMTPAVAVSSDDGMTWSEPKDGQIHDLPMRSLPNSPLIYNDRIWRSYWSLSGSNWVVHLLWAPYDSNWLDRESWTVVTPLKGRRDFLGGSNDRVADANPIPIPGGVGLLARCDSKNRRGSAALLPVSADGKSIEFNQLESLVDFPGGGNKFTVRYDSKSEKYWAIVNKQKNPFAHNNYQVLISSQNLRDWTTNSVLFRHLNNYYFGKHHCDWVIDGEDLIAVSLVAWEGAKSSDFPTHTVFDRIKGFRSLNSTRVGKVYGPDSRPVTLTSKSARVTGKYVDVQTLKEGIGSVSHFATKYTKIPDRIKGWRFVRTRGGFPSEIVVSATIDCEIFMVSDVDGTGVIDVTGWTREPEMLMRGDKSSQLFSRKLSAGERVVLPQGTWHGSQLLLPPGF